MTKPYHRNAGKEWTHDDYATLRELDKEATPVTVMSLKLGRSPGAVRQMLRFTRAFPK